MPRATTGARATGSFQMCQPLLDNAPPSWHFAALRHKQEKSVRACLGLAALVSQSGQVGGAL